MRLVYLSAGASHGCGIYLASHATTSLAYTSISSWPRTKPLPRSQLLALCEVVHPSSNQPFIVVPQNERVCLRFLFALPEGGGGINVTAQQLLASMPLSLKYSLQYPL